MERLLLAPPPATQSDAIATTPTLGLCPLCRQALYLFELQHVDTGKRVFENDNSNNTTRLPPELACHSVFVESTPSFPGVIGRGSYHFPTPNNESSSPSSSDPYYNVSEVPSSSNDDTTVSRFVGLSEGLCKNGEPTVNPSTVPQDYRGAGLILE